MYIISVFYNGKERVWKKIEVIHLGQKVTEEPHGIAVYWWSSWKVAWLHISALNKTDELCLSYQWLNKNLEKVDLHVRGGRFELFSGHIFIAISNQIFSVVLQTKKKTCLLPEVHQCLVFDDPFEDAEFSVRRSDPY